MASLILPPISAMMGRDQIISGSRQPRKAHRTPHAHTRGARKPISSPSASKAADNGITRPMAKPEPKDQQQHRNRCWRRSQQQALRRCPPAIIVFRTTRSRSAPGCPPTANAHHGDGSGVGPGYAHVFSHPPFLRRSRRQGKGRWPLGGAGQTGLARCRCAGPQIRSTGQRVVLNVAHLRALDGGQPGMRAGPARTVMKGRRDDRPIDEPHELNGNPFFIARLWWGGPIYVLGHTDCVDGRWLLSVPSVPGVSTWAWRRSCLERVRSGLSAGCCDASTRRCAEDQRRRHVLHRCAGIATTGRYGAL